MSTRGPVAFYDADCGFCTRSVGVVARLRLGTRFEELQTAELAAYGITMDEALESMAFVDAAGRVSFGHHAWAGILKTGNPLLRTLGVVLDSQALERPAGFIYRWIADNRERMPGGTPACSLADRIPHPR